MVSRWQTHLVSISRILEGVKANKSTFLLNSATKYFSSDLGNEEPYMVTWWFKDIIWTSFRSSLGVIFSFSILNIGSQLATYVPRAFGCGRCLGRHVPFSLPSCYDIILRWPPSPFILIKLSLVLDLRLPRSRNNLYERRNGEANSLLFRETCHSPLLTPSSYHYGIGHTTPHILTNQTSHLGNGQHN